MFASSREPDGVLGTECCCRDAAAKDEVVCDIVGGSRESGSNFNSRFKGSQSAECASARTVNNFEARSCQGSNRWTQNIEHVFIR